MSLLALSYPEINPVDRNWIQKFRSQYDPNYTLLGPHFTLVHPVDSVDRETFLDHIRTVLQRQAAISFVVRCATVVPNRVDGGWHIFLVPDEGFSEMVKLHNRLYTKCLTQHLRMDLNFIPHMTVGFDESAERAKALADELNARDFDLAGRLTVVDVADYRDNRLETIERIAIK